MNNTISSEEEYHPREIAERQYDDSLFILDVRNADEFEEWHVDGSVNLPIYDQLLDGNFIGLEANLDMLPENKEIAVMCVAGVTSARAADFLQDHGYDAQSISNGMNGWGRVHIPYSHPDSTDIIQIVRPGTGCISYLVHDDNEAIVIDPSLYIDEYLNIADDHDLDLIATIDTHAHADHISGGPALRDDLGIPYYLHSADSGELDAFTPLDDNDIIPIGNRELEVIHTPGHTPGSITLQFENGLLTGDTLFIRSVGRPDLEGSAETEIRTAAHDLFASLQRVAAKSDDLIVFPGHYSDESIRPVATSLSELKSENELFGMSDKDRFVDTIVESLSDKPANYNRIKAINWGKEPVSEEAATLELGPNNCAAN